MDWATDPPAGGVSAAVEILVHLPNFIGRVLGLVGARKIFPPWTFALRTVVFLASDGCVNGAADDFVGIGPDGWPRGLCDSFSKIFGRAMVPLPVCGVWLLDLERRGMVFARGMPFHTPLPRKISPWYVCVSGMR
jgi:hypothetical protein